MNFEIIEDKEKLYDKCENMEQLYDKYYLPLLEVHYRKTYKLQQENQQLKIQVSSREEVANKYKEVIDKAIKYIEYNDEDLYVYNPDYDYEENIVSNYDVTTFREDLLDILKEVK